ncbi:hypothetical protein MA16_Dca025395 [Dendrobium catenatum]|uniref:Uncharacterized protein n=1 Tax=Dendrobium catenatum TaxID=906689 RepID=A0A2I0WA00_9ASPA|nr:hypothetical protein MA16_Dca025395 [Dendrobium catenatum]
MGPTTYEENKSLKTELKIGQHHRANAIKLAEEDIGGSMEKLRWDHGPHGPVHIPDLTGQPPNRRQSRMSTRRKSTPPFPPLWRQPILAENDEISKILVEGFSPQTGRLLENCGIEEKMAGEEMPKQSSERRRSRAGLNLHANFNGGVVLLLGAAAGALLASAFAAHRIRAHKRRRGSMKEGIQGDSGDDLAALEAKEFVGDEGGEGDGANAGEGVFQISSSPANTFHNLGEKQLVYDEAASVKEECKASCVNCEEDDEEDNEKAYIEELDEREEIYDYSDLRSEQPRLLEVITLKTKY